MRLIDAECLCDLVEQSSILSAGFKQVFEKIVAGEPTVDAVPVVRCREYRYYAVSGATTSFCIHPGGMKFTSDSDYCSRGRYRSNQSADVRNMEEGNEHE